MAFVADTLPEMNSKFAPENACLEDAPFFWGKRPIFKGNVTRVSMEVIVTI